ncbi:MAG: hypothetical protein ACYC4R_02125 [Anaerolineae bacterium]
MKDAIERTMRRTQSYWYEDGLAEITSGIGLALIGAFFYGQSLLAAHTAWVGLLALLLPVVVVGGTFAMRWLLREAKARITYPRTGYVAYPRKPRRKRLTAAVGAGMGAVVAGFIASSPSLMHWIPTIQGLLMGGLLLFVAYKLSLTRFFCLAIFSVLAGVAVALIEPDLARAEALYFGLVGAGQLISGAVTFARYLAHNQPVAE